MSNYKHCQVKLYYKQDAEIIKHLIPFEASREVSAELRRLIRLGWQVTANRLPAAVPVGLVPSGPVLTEVNVSLLETAPTMEPVAAPKDRVKRNLDRLGGMFEMG